MTAVAEETDAVTDDGAYLLRSPDNARRLLTSIEELEAGRGVERDHDTAAGIFRHLIHRLDDDARTVSHDGLTFWVAVCGAVSVPTDRPDPSRGWCARCWPSLWPTNDPEETDS